MASGQDKTLSTLVYQALESYAYPRIVIVSCQDTTIVPAQSSLASRTSRSDIGPGVVRRGEHEVEKCFNGIGICPWATTCSVRSGRRVVVGLQARCYRLVRRIR